MYKEKIKTKEEIKQICEELKRQGKTIVTTNGSFDVINVGHANLVHECKKQGDILVVGLNSDISIKQYKGSDRPINIQRHRAWLLAAFKDVDYITIFNETDPREFIKNIEPNFHCNSSEYGEDCIEAETVKQGGGKLVLIPRFTEEGVSSSKIIDELKK